jgi:hypothetical protein
MRANSIGPSRSAALVISSAAVRMTGVPRSDDGTVLTRWTIASRNDADSDEVARVKRDEAARDSWMMSPAVTE